MALSNRPIRGRLEIVLLKTSLSEFDQDELFQSEVPLKNGQMMDLYSAVTRASAKRASKTISNLNTSQESIFHALSELVLEIFLLGHMTEQMDF